MNNNRELGHCIRTFFEDYLTRQRQVSPHTVLSYRDSLKLFLRYAAQRYGVAVDQLTIEQLDSKTVLAFLEYLEEERGNCTATRNSRLAALRTFFRHVAARDPRRMDSCQGVMGIPAKRGFYPTMTYLEPEELKAVLSDIDRTTQAGRRDYLLVSLIYQTGARVQEAVDLRACDLQLESTPNVRIWGKGRRERIVPLWTKTTALLRAWLTERGIDPRSTDSVFVNLCGQPLTRWGVRYILAKHAISAAQRGTMPVKKVSPHTLRHTTAVHMLQAGVGTDAIRDFLGHSSAATTWRYARINMEMKRKAIEACALHKDAANSPAPIWKRDEGLLEQLEAMGRRDNYVKPKAP